MEGHVIQTDDKHDGKLYVDRSRRHYQWIQGLLRRLSPYHNMIVLFNLAEIDYWSKLKGYYYCNIFSARNKSIHFHDKQPNSNFLFRQFRIEVSSVE